MSKRCGWCGEDQLYCEYHDTEWGVPCRDDRKLFEMLNLEGAQAGLSWITVLRKRESYSHAFDNFDPHKIIQYDAKKIQSLLHDPGIIRNRLKVNAVVQNAQAFLELQQNGTTLTEFLWAFTDGVVMQNNWRSLGDVPASTPESQAMSKALKTRGFKFVGPTICYAFMQACGMANDHLVNCYRHSELQ